MAQKTVFVIGAGASKEVNFPIGSELKVTVSDLLNIDIGDFGKVEKGDSTIWKALDAHAQGTASDIAKLLDAAHQVRRGMPLVGSIDNFLDIRQGDEAIKLCGKLAIVRAILKAEQKSLLYFKPERADSTINFNLTGKSWFGPFFQLLTERCTFKGLEKRLSDLTFVVFNYDRCFEHYLHHALKTLYYNENREEIRALLSELDIYHPYGTVGTLPWCPSPHMIDYGSDPNSQQLLDLATQIKTFTEGTDPSASDILAIRDRISRAQRLVFLGFGFNAMNLDLMFTGKAAQRGDTSRYIFASALGMSESDRGVLCEDLASRSGISEDSMSIALGKTCADLFHDYRLSLSLL